MSPRHGAGPDGIWRIGPVRLLTAVGVGYLTVVLTLAAVTADLDAGQSTAAGHSPAPGAGTDAAGPPATEGPGYHTPSAPVPTRSPATSVGAGGDVRVGSAENRSEAPPPPPPAPPATKRPSTPPAPPVVTSYEAESPTNGLADTRIYTCYGCSGDKKVGNIGRDMGTLQFNGVTARAGGPATVTIAYVNGEYPRVGYLSVNSEPPLRLTFPHTGGWSSVDTMVVTLALRPGSNTLKMFNPYEPAPDFDKITVSVR